MQILRNKTACLQMEEWFVINTTIGNIYSGFLVAIWFTFEWVNACNSCHRQGQSPRRSNLVNNFTLKWKPEVKAHRVSSCPLGSLNNGAFIAITHYA